VIRIEFRNEQGVESTSYVGNDERWVEICQRFEKRVGIVPDPAELLRQSQLLAKWRAAKK
jgi:hypothetical protein